MVVAFFLLAALAADPRALLERARELEKANEAERARYFAREDIQLTREQPDGSRRQMSWVTYEAMMVDGRLRYRRVARDGKPLPVNQQRLQPEGRRSSFDWKQLLAQHDLTLVGEEVVDGRRAWRIRTSLRPEAPLPKKLSDVALSGPFEIWIDQATGLESKLRWRVERPWANWTRGATVETWTLMVDRFFVLKRVLVRVPKKDRVEETDQTYTNYRRFSGESSIRFETP